MEGDKEMAKGCGVKQAKGWLKKKKKLADETMNE